MSVDSNESGQVADDMTRLWDTQSLKLIQRRVPQLRKWRYCVGSIPYPPPHIELLDRYPEARVFATRQGYELPLYMRLQVRIQRTGINTRIWRTPLMPHTESTSFFLPCTPFFSVRQRDSF